MRVRTVLPLMLSMVAVCSLPAAAQKEKAPGVPDLPFWSMKGRPARQFVPGLNAALLLTAEQQEKLAAARQETVGSEAVAAAARTVKTDTNATAEQKQAALETVATANARLRQSVESVLTPEQKALIEKVNSLFAEAQAGAALQFEGDLVAAKGNEEASLRLRGDVRDRAEAEFVRRIESLLTPEQREAMQKAAAEEKRAAEAAARAKTAK